MKARDVALKHLEVLDGTMSRVSAEANQFSGRFLFGGVVAVIALLNTDLLIDRQVRIDRLHWGWALLLVAAVLVVSGLYFRVVAERILYFRRQYRLTKHKYDLTLYALLTNCRAAELVGSLEFPLKPVVTGGPLPFPHGAPFPQVADYLHDHHGRALARLSLRRDWSIGMLVVLATLVIKALVYLVASGS